jgi:hypothetical protein
MKRILYVFTLAVFAVSCGSGSQEGSQDSTAVTNESASAPETGKKYSIKSGIIHQESEAMGIKMNPVVYFDDYGSKECTEIIMEMKMFGQTIKTHSATITKDGFIYSIDYEKKTGTKMKSYVTGSSSAAIDFKSLSDEMKTKMNLKDLGSEEYLGKKCQKYSIDYKDMDMKGTYLVYDNIPMKMEATIGQMNTKLSVIKFEENVTVPTEKFDVPADIIITDADAAKPEQK